MTPTTDSKWRFCLRISRFFRECYVVDNRLSPQYEKGWNDAVCALSASIRPLYEHREPFLNKLLEHTERPNTQAELTALLRAALRAKLAAAEASLAERARMLETTHRVQRAYRATVAAELAELRAHWNAQYQHYVSMTDDSSWERRQELLDRMRELDATIAKLDLQEQPQ